MNAIDTTLTASEVAERFRCGTRKVTETATKNGIGANLGGPAGYRFTETDVLALWEAMRPVPPASGQQKRRRA